MVRDQDLSTQRLRLVHAMSQERYLRDPRIRDAFLRVPREEFVRPTDRSAAYADSPLSIGDRQTISAPSMIAIMLEEARLEPGERVLEIGTGSGYQAALVACLVGPAQVVTIERVPTLAAWGEQNLRRCGFGDVKVVRGDGTLGYPPLAPYDCIIATAGAPHIPAAWAAQLSAKGRIVAPIGRSRFAQELVVARVQPNGALDVRTATPCAFVPLVGADGWPGDGQAVEGG